MLPYDVRKEIRALAPTWGASASVIVAAALWREPSVLPLAAVAYGIGCIALGAQVFGHEYSYRTLGLLLSQPVGRGRTLIVKFGTLGLMILALTVLAWPVLFVDGPSIRRAAGSDVQVLLLLAATCAVSLAPFLSILCRSALAAIVFTVGIPGALIVVGDVIGAWVYGLANAAAVDRFKYAMFWRAMLPLCAAAAAACWWMFLRLEAIEGRGGDFHWPGWLAGKDAPAASAGHPSPVWQLALKELRLQQVTLVVVVLYVCGYLLLARIARDVPEVADPTTALSMLYGALLAMLIGALAIAEERQMGTLEWQTLLPIPAWQQWAVKSGSVFSLVLLLGVALPYALRILTPLPGDRLEYEVPREVVNMMILALVLASVALYVSSVSSSGVRALVLSFPAIALAAAATSIIAWVVQGISRWMGIDEMMRAMTFSIHSPSSGVWLAICLGFIAMAVSFAAVNHRSADHGVRRIAAQTSWMLGYTSVFMTLMTS